MRKVREVTSEEENFRLEPVAPDLPNMRTIRRDPVEPEPVGTIVVKMFRIAGYSPDCDGSLLAELEGIDNEGRTTGWRESHMGMYSDSTWVVENLEELDQLSKES